MEDSSRYSGLKFIAACNGTTAGGGYEIALACDEILLIDDRSSTVSLPEVPLLGVLPGTGGLTRLTDKRRVRHDLADIFCTLTEGVRGTRAKEWRLIDDLAKPQQFAAKVRERALALAAGSDRPAGERGVDLTPLKRTMDDDGYHYEHVDVAVTASARTATLTITAPGGNEPTTLADIKARGAAWWPLAMARELDDAILMLRTNDPEVGTWILKTRGNVERVLAVDDVLAQLKDDWFVRETIGQLRRTFARLETSSRTLFAVIDRGSCFAGTLFELSLAADRAYMLHSADDATGPKLALSPMNFGAYPTIADEDRLTARFYGDEAQLAAVRGARAHRLGAEEALRLGLVTATPDELDWDHELRIAIEERVALSPDALTGLEASLRFGGAETMTTKIFGRLSAWQNWVFTRPNAVGETGALTVFGTGSKAKFNWERA
jgi:benzoyl-CoA-dihydrodiol lyase